MAQRDLKPESNLANSSINESGGGIADKDLAYKVKAGAFLAVSAGVGLLFGFGGALAAAKKSDPASFDQGLTGDLEAPATSKASGAARHQQRLHQSGAALATRALGYGTLCAVAGCAALFATVWKLSGARDLQDFRSRAGAVLPVLPKGKEGRTEFSGLNDLLGYLIEEDEKKKRLRAAKND